MRDVGPFVLFVQPGDPNDKIPKLETVANLSERRMTYLPGIEQRVDSFFASSMDAVITINGSSQIVQFNHAAEKMFRCPAEDALGSPIGRFIIDGFQRSDGDICGSFSFPRNPWANWVICTA